MFGARQEGKTLAYMLMPIEAQIASIYAPLYGMSAEDLLEKPGALPLGLRFNATDGGIGVYGERAVLEGDGVSLNALSGAIRVDGASLGRLDSRSISIAARDELSLGGASFLSTGGVSVESYSSDILSRGKSNTAFLANTYVFIKAAGDIGLGESAFLRGESFLIDAGDGIKARSLDVKGSSASTFSAVAGEGDINVANSTIAVGSGSIEAEDGDILSNDSVLTALSPAMGSWHLKAGLKGYEDEARYSEVFSALPAEEAEASPEAPGASASF